MKLETLKLSVEAAVARIVLARPAHTNVVDARLVRELADSCAALGEDTDVRVVTLTADGRDFGAGWSAEVLAGDEGPTVPADPFGCLQALALPVVCGVQGRVESAGLELALACDFRVAAAGARFAMPETASGLLPLAGGTQRLPRLVGRGRALAMLLAGEELDADGAYRAGLVARVVPDDRLSDEVQAIALRIAERGPVAERYAKEAVHRGLDMTLEQALRYETDLTVILQTTKDRAEGVRAFLEKRTPRFTGD